MFDIENGFTEVGDFFRFRASFGCGHFAGCGVDGGAHAVVRSAAADVGHRLVNVLVGRIRLVLDQRGRGHDHAGLTEAALRHVERKMSSLTIKGNHEKCLTSDLADILERAHNALQANIELNESVSHEILTLISAMHEIILLLRTFSST